MVNAGTFELMRMWAALTGVVLALWYFVELALGAGSTQILPMLVTGIGGFEAFLYGQDLWARRKSRQG